MGPDQPALRCTDVTLLLDGTRVLAHVDWEVHAGERWVVLGANGAGKTTLLRVAALYQHPSSGTVDVLGARLGRADVRTLRERIAFSSPALAARLEPSMHALEVVMTARYAALAPWWHRYTDDDRARAGALLDEWDCGALATHTFGTLSAGERQRVLLAARIDERTRNRAARRADRRPRRRRAGRARRRSRGVGPRPAPAATRARDTPHRGSAARLHARARAEGGSACWRTARSPRS